MQLNLRQLNVGCRIISPANDTFTVTEDDCSYSVVLPVKLIVIILFYCYCSVVSRVKLIVKSYENEPMN